MRKVFGAMVALAGLAAIQLTASVDGDRKRLTEAATVLQEIHQVPDKDIPDDLWAKAECIAVIPSVKKAAFIVGGEYGKGPVSCRIGNGWSAPAFLELQKGSIGFQIGAESVDLVLLVMNRKGVDRLLDSKVALGTEASVAGGPVGRDVRAMTDVQMKAEILSYSRAQGLFAGIDLTGGVLKADTDENKEFYGRAMNATDILKGGTLQAPPGSSVFLNALKRTMPAHER